jgi:hypothetical protein
MDTQSVMVSVAAGCVSLSAVIASYMQIANANRKLKLDLYEKRIAIYTTAVDYCVLIADDNSTPAMLFSLQIRASKVHSESLFLFELKDEIYKTLQTLVEAGIIVTKYQAMKEQRDNGKTTHEEVGQMRMARATATETLAQLQTQIRPYLDFTKV